MATKTNGTNAQLQADVLRAQHQERFAEARQGEYRAQQHNQPEVRRQTPDIRERDRRGFIRWARHRWRFAHRERQQRDGDECRYNADP